jgi:hypothetical protein
LLATTSPSPRSSRPTSSPATLRAVARRGSIRAEGNETVGEPSSSDEVRSIGAPARRDRRSKVPSMGERGGLLTCPGAGPHWWHPPPLASIALRVPSSPRRGDDRRRSAPAPSARTW